MVIVGLPDSVGLGTRRREIWLLGARLSSSQAGGGYRRVPGGARPPMPFPRARGQSSQVPGHRLARTLQPHRSTGDTHAPPLPSVDDELNSVKCDLIDMKMQMAAMAAASTQSEQRVAELMLQVVRLSAVITELGQDAAASAPASAPNVSRNSLVDKGTGADDAGVANAHAERPTASDLE